MLVKRIARGLDGHAVLSDVELDVTEQLPGFESVPHGLSPPFASSAVRFACFPAQDQGLHPAPWRQIAVVLSGEMEVETTDGTKHLFRQGDLVIADDVETPGHYTRFPRDTTYLLFIPLDDAIVWLDG